MRSVDSGHRGAHRAALTLVEVLVVVAILILLAGIVVVATSQARVSAGQSSSISNLKQLALAGSLYNEEWSAFPSSAGVLCVNDESLQEVCASPLDSNEQGLANIILAESYEKEPSGPEIGFWSFKLSYPGFYEWRISDFVRREVIEGAQNAGWLVDQTQLTKLSSTAPFLLSEGTYSRLTFGGAVINRKPVVPPGVSPESQGTVRDPMLFFFDDNGEYERLFSSLNLSIESNL